MEASKTQWLEISVKVCSWDLGAQLHKNVSSQSLYEYVEEVWYLSSGVVGRRRLLVTNSLKYRDADGFLMALLQIIDLNE